MKHLSDELLISYQLEELSSEETIEVENHLEKCDICQNQYEELISLASAWVDPSYLPSVEFTDRMMNVINSEQTSLLIKTHHKKKRRQTWLNLAISAAATIVLAYMGMFNEITSVSYQFIGGLTDATSRLEVITSNGSRIIQNLDLQYIFQQIEQGVNINE